MGPLEEVDQEVTEADQVSEFQHDQGEEEEPSFASVADLATTDHHTLELLVLVEHQLQPSAILTTSAEVDAAQETEGSKNFQIDTQGKTTTMEKLELTYLTEQNGLVLKPSDTLMELKSEDGIQDPEFAKVEDICVKSTHTDFSFD